jgi:hypothetical protein
MFSAVPRASGPVFMFYAPELICGGDRGRPIPFSCFPLPDMSSEVPGASGPVFIFCAPGLVFGDIMGVRSRFHVLCTQIRFRRYRGRRVPFSCFAHPDSFSPVPRASGLVFMFCAPSLVFGGTEGVGSCFHVLRSRTRFRRYRGRRVSFSCFALLNSFSAISGASGLVFLFYAPGLIFDGTKGVGSHFYVLRFRTRFRRYRGRRVPFSCFALPNSFFGSTRDVRCRFLVLCSRTRFRRCRGRRVSFSC